MTGFTFKLGQPAKPVADVVVETVNPNESLDKPGTYDVRVKDVKMADVPIDLIPIVQLLHNAKRNLKWPKLLIDTELFGGTVLRLSLAGPNSRTPGAVNVTDNHQNWGQRVYYGKIDTKGNWRPSRDLSMSTTNPVYDELLEIANDPVGYARVHGQKYSFCMFCGKELTHHDSVAVGYGPICADKWGLPWEGMAEQVDADKREQQIDDKLGDIDIDSEQLDWSEYAPVPGPKTIEELEETIKEFFLTQDWFEISWREFDTMHVQTKTSPAKEFLITIKDLDNPEA